MSNASLAISFTADRGLSSTADRVFVHLEQVVPNEQQNSVTMFDIQQMVSRARNGMSARTYKSPGCPAYIDGDSIVMNFDFHAWPSDPDLIYALTSGLGNITDPIVIQKQVEFSATFEMSDVVEFDFILEDIDSAEWETECYDSQGRVVDNVTVEMDGYTTLRASAVVFGVVRIIGTKRGARHTLTSRLVKSQAEPPSQQEFDDSGAGRYTTYNDFMGMYWPSSNIDSWTDVHGEEQTPPPEPVNYTGLKLTNLKVSVTAHWVVDHEEKTDQLIIEAPQCIKDLLAVCDGDEDKILSGGDRTIRGGSGEDLPWNVYVSGCTGNFLVAIRPEEDESSWSGK